MFISHILMEARYILRIYCQLYIITPFELQPEDSLIKKAKHVANMIF